MKGREQERREQEGKGIGREGNRKGTEEKEKKESKGLRYIQKEQL